MVVIVCVWQFQHTAARRRLGRRVSICGSMGLFQHTAARRRLGVKWLKSTFTSTFQHTAARRRLGDKTLKRDLRALVSTHSRPKAAGSCSHDTYSLFKEFQHTAARRRLARANITYPDASKVSTHSRPKAAGQWYERTQTKYIVSTHSRPKAAGTSSVFGFFFLLLFQHTAARRRLALFNRSMTKTAWFNTQPPEGGWLVVLAFSVAFNLFQHTAARRRLG